MTAILIDSSVLLDIATDDPVWCEWSARQIWRMREQSDLVVNAMIYAEVSAAFRRIEEADAFFSSIDVRREDVPWAAAFAAGQLHRSARQLKLAGRLPLPDYFIACHAMICGYQLLSRDNGYLRQPFAALSLIHPGNQA